MPRELRLRGLVRPGRSDRKDDRRGLSDTLPACFAGRRGDGQRETDLAAAGQLDIDLRQQLRVDQSAVLDAQAAVESVARAERIETGLGAWMTLPRQQQAIEQNAHPDEGANDRPQHMDAEDTIENVIAGD